MSLHYTRERVLAQPKSFAWNIVLELLQFSQEELLEVRQIVHLPLEELIRFQKCLTQSFLIEHFLSEIDESLEVDWVYVKKYVTL